MMIGNNIKKLRMQRGMTQKNLADILFVSPQAVSRWENNEVEPSIGTITEMAKIFNVSEQEVALAFEKDENEFTNSLRATPLTDKNTISLPILAECLFIKNNNKNGVVDRARTGNPWNHNPVLWPIELQPPLQNNTRKIYL